MEKILEVRNLKTYFYMGDGVVRAVDGVDFPVYRGKCLGIVGESGCGKSVTAQSIMRIVPSPPGRIVDGEILLRKNGSWLDLARPKASDRLVRSVRGKDITMIFQEPMTSLSPVHTVESQITESIRLHQGASKKEARDIALEMLEKVRIPRPEAVLREYPYQLSGGMRQRAMIALALSCNPKLLIADEPTTALDVTVQASILKLIKELQDDFGMGLILITHNLGVIAQTADFVAVYYLGIIVEYGEVYDVFEKPLHPYTRALFSSIPRLEGTTRLAPIKGSVPDPYAIIRGCPFRNRCSEAIKPCWSDDVPALEERGANHTARCYLYGAETEGGTGG
jgi:oligopeptide/dipeptide ABC transporter ATP-binding protein